MLRTSMTMWTVCYRYVNPSIRIVNENIYAPDLSIDRLQVSKDVEADIEKQS